jgi:alpha-D-ribose 1-methylphosphonate 5-triphosphate synthase subunit PhnL
MGSRSLRERKSGQRNYSNQAGKISNRASEHDADLLKALEKQCLEIRKPNY